MHCSSNQSYQTVRFAAVLSDEFGHLADHFSHAVRMAFIQTAEDLRHAINIAQNAMNLARNTVSKQQHQQTSLRMRAFTAQT